MKKHLLFISILLLSCARNQSHVKGLVVSSAHVDGANVVPVTVSCGYVNEPCVSVTVCNPNDPTQCQTVDNILVDTGSYGLRVFASTVSNVGLTPISTGAGEVGECQYFLDNSADWGPLAMANVQLGDETTNQPIPIQLIDSNFPQSGSPGAGAQSAHCSHPDDSPANAGFNGILGIGPHITDCGIGCAMSANNGMYFACKADGTCTNVAMPEGAPGTHLPYFQLSNPIAYMPTDNNGSALILPGLDLSGAARATGYLILGIGTNANNTVDSSSVTVLPTGNPTTFTTNFQGHSYSGSFIDSGSNGLFFPQDDSGLPTDGSGFYDPSTITPFTATFDVGGITHAIAFNILGSSVAFAPFSPNMAFNDLGAEYPGGFDWGLPFFFGRTVFVGIEGKTSNLGSGAYWAF